MKTRIIILVVLFICSMKFVIAKNDSTTLLTIESRLRIIDDNLKEVRRDQLNYTLEKNLLKDTYTNNFDRINFTLTLILGIFGILGYLGLTNINSIKKEYTLELNDLKKIRQDFELKLQEFNSVRTKYDNEIEAITRTNLTQNIKIQILELKEKTKKLIKEKELATALETITIALELDPKDTSMLSTKSIIYSRLGQYKEAVKSLKLAYDYDSSNESIIINLVEMYYFNNQIKEAKELMQKNDKLFVNNRDGKLKQYLDTIDVYHNGNVEELKQIIESQIDKEDLVAIRKRFDWDFDDIHWFHAYVKYPVKEELLIIYIWYIKGDRNGQDVLTELNLKI